MSSQGKGILFEPPVKFVLDRTILLIRKMSRLEPTFRFIYKRILTFETKFIDRYMPDRLLLFYMNILDKYVPPKAIDVVIEEVDKHVPHKLRSSFIAAADEYIPDRAASSRKISAIMAGVGKYIPDRIIPSESLDSWANLKLKFHIPTLLSRGQSDSRKE